MPTKCVHAGSQGRECVSNDTFSEISRSLLNVATTTDGQTKVNGNETEWITVESKKAARQAKRIVSRTSSAETRNDHGNGEAKCKRVRFESE